MHDRLRLARPAGEVLGPERQPSRLAGITHSSSPGSQFQWHLSCAQLWPFSFPAAGCIARLQITTKLVVLDYFGGNFIYASLYP